MNSIDKINLLLTKLGMTGADLERAIGVSQSVYSQWNTGRTTPSKRSLSKIAIVLGVSIEELLPDETKKESASITGNELNKSLIEKLSLLTDEEMLQVSSFVQGLIASRKV